MRPGDRDMSYWVTSMGPLIAALMTIWYFIHWLQCGMPLGGGERFGGY